MNGQALFHPGFDSRASEAGSSGPFGKAKSLPIMSQHDIASPICLLLNASSPSAVARLVVAIIVWEPVNGVLWAWRQSNIGKKCVKGRDPRSADGDAATSVVREPRILWVAAATDHALPDFSCSLNWRASRFDSGVIGNWRIQNLCSVPTESNASANSVYWDACESGPFGNRPGLPVVLDANVSASVVHLNQRSGPADVSWLVPAIIVDAFQGVLFARGFANVIEECLKRLSPAITDGDSPATVIGKVRSFGIVTSLFDASPEGVLLGATAAVREIGSMPGVISKTPATPCVAIFDSMARLLDDTAAGTAEFPDSNTVWATDEANGRQSAEFLPRLNAEFLGKSLAHSFDADASASLDFARHDMGGSLYGQFAAGAEELPEEMPAATLAGRFYGYEATMLVA